MIKININMRENEINMLEIELLKKALKQRYNEDRAILCNINVCKVGILNNEVLIVMDEPDFTIMERVKQDISMKDIYKILDEAIYKKDYEYSYYGLKKFWNEHKIDKLGFEKVFGDSLFEAKEDEILVSIKNYIFSVLFNDDEFSYKVNKLYFASKKDNGNAKNDTTVVFESLNENSFNLPYHDEIEQGVIQLQINRKEAKNQVDEKGKMLIVSMYETLEKMKNNLEKIKGVSK